CKLVDLALDGLVVDRVEWSLQIILDVQPQHRMRRDEIDLKLDVGRNYAGALKLGKYLERADRVVGVQQIAEGDVLDAAPGTQRVASMRARPGVDAEHLAGRLQNRAGGKNRLEPRDPVETFAGLAVWQPFEVCAHSLTDVPEHAFSGLERHTAHE